MRHGWTLVWRTPLPPTASRKLVLRARERRASPLFSQWFRLSMVYRHHHRGPLFVLSAPIFSKAVNLGQEVPNFSHSRIKCLLAGLGCRVGVSLARPSATSFEPRTDHQWPSVCRVDEVSAGFRVQHLDGQGLNHGLAFSFNGAPPPTASIMLRLSSSACEPKADIAKRLRAAQTSTPR